MRIIMVGDGGDGELASVSVLLFFTEGERWSFHSSLKNTHLTLLTPSTCVQLDTSDTDTHTHTRHRYTHMHIYGYPTHTPGSHTHQPHSPFRKAEK